MLNALTIEDYGWKNHPAVKMWAGHEVQLAYYGYIMCREWERRGYNPGVTIGKIMQIAAKLTGDVSRPDWMGDERVHSSHRAVLLSKDYAHYSQFGWTEEPEYNYYWPVS